jgi:hypothetical protein
MTTTTQIAAASFIPTRQWVADLQLGDLAPTCFGKWARVVEIFARRDDIRGRLFVCLYLAFGSDHGRISESFKEGEPHVTVSGTMDAQPEGN